MQKKGLLRARNDTSGRFSCHCEKRSDEAISFFRHCEERSDEAISMNAKKGIASRSQ
jgi:hypothetical protein